MSCSWDTTLQFQRIRNDRVNKGKPEHDHMPRDPPQWQSRQPDWTTPAGYSKVLGNDPKKVEAATWNATGLVRRAPTSADTCRSSSTPTSAAACAERECKMFQPPRWYTAFPEVLRDQVLKGP